MSTDTRFDQEGIAARMPDPYAYHTKHGEPRWTHQDTDLYVALVRTQSVPEGRMDRQTAMSSDDRVWRFEVRPDGPGSYAEVYERLGGSRSAALEHALAWLQAHRDGRLDG